MHGSIMSLQSNEECILSASSNLYFIKLEMLYFWLRIVSLYDTIGSENEATFY